MLFICILLFLKKNRFCQFYFFKHVIAVVKWPRVVFIISNEYIYILFIKYTNIINNYYYYANWSKNILFL